MIWIYCAVSDGHKQTKDKENQFEGSVFNDPSLTVTTCWDKCKLLRCGLRACIHLCIFKINGKLFVIADIFHLKFKELIFKLNIVRPQN